MLDRETAALLMCPQCRLGGLRGEWMEHQDRLLDGTLTCEACDAAYAVEQGIPRLIPAVVDDDSAWQTWREHLDGFAARRADRAAHHSAGREERWSLKLRGFAEFVDAPAGRLLDVGCGPGNLRKLLDPSRVQYVGIDPLPIAEAREFAFVGAVAEAIPFRDGVFNTVVVRSALDHFRDLDGFFGEASRVLTEDGRMFLEQVVHGTGGLRGLVRDMVHAAKDMADNVRIRQPGRAAPKHMREFSPASLAHSLQHGFEAKRMATFNSHWCAPTQMFVELRRCAAAISKAWTN